MGKVTALVLAIAALGACTEAAPGPISCADTLSARVRSVVDSARDQTAVTNSYDPSYVRIAYPGGDVPSQTGVCSDVVVRAFRAAGVDLQREVHEDMLRAFKSYPQRWGLKAPDANIDHRRVPNLMTYFARTGKSVPITSDARDYRPGDVVAWDLGGGVTHIGLVADECDAATLRPLVVHNIGAGTRTEDVLFAWTVIGHYRPFE